MGSTRSWSLEKRNNVAVVGRAPTIGSACSRIHPGTTKTNGEGIRPTIDTLVTFLQ